MSMSRDELELAISRRLDGTLPLPRRAALDEELSRDPAARRLHDQHAALDAALRSLPRITGYDEQALADRIVASIDASHARDEAFFARVDQPASDQPAADASDAELRPHRLVASALRSLRADRPAVDHDAYAARIAASLDDLDAAASDPSLDDLLRRALPTPTLDERAIPDAVAESLRHRITPATAPASRPLVRRMLRPLSAAAVLLLTASLAFQLARWDTAMPADPVAPDYPGRADPSPDVNVVSSGGTAAGPRVAEFEFVAPMRIESASADVQVGRDGRLTLFPSHLRDLLDDSPTTRPIDLASPRRQ